MHHPFRNWIVESKDDEVMLRILEKTEEKKYSKREAENCPIKAAGGKKAEKEETGQGGAV